MRRSTAFAITGGFFFALTFTPISKMLVDAIWLGKPLFPLIALAFLMAAYLGREGL